MMGWYDTAPSTSQKHVSHIVRPARVGRRQRMNWINKVFLLAAGLAIATTLLSYAFGFGWLSLIAASPTFIGVTVLVPFFLGLRDRRLVLEKRHRQGRRRRIPRKRMTRPVPAAPNKAGAPLAERGGRVLATLPAAPL